MSETEHHIWDQIECESDRWFQRFEAFRLDGVGRTVMAIYLAEWRKRREKASKSLSPEPKAFPGAWEKAVKNFNWRIRAAAWDQYLSEQKEAAIEEKWQAEIMKQTEILGRMSQIGRVNIADFVELGDDGHITGLNQEFLKENGHLVKRITSSKGKTNSIGIELRSGHEALEWLGQYLGLTNNKSITMSFDLSKLSTRQLELLAEGKDLLHVLLSATSGES